MPTSSNRVAKNGPVQVMVLGLWHFVLWRQLFEDTRQSMPQCWGCMRAMKWQWCLEQSRRPVQCPKAAEKSSAVFADEFTSCQGHRYGIHILLSPLFFCAQPHRLRSSLPHHCYLTAFSCYQFWQFPSHPGQILWPGLVSVPVSVLLFTVAGGIVKLAS